MPDERPRITHGLPQEQIEKAVRDSGGTEHGRVMKVIYTDDKGNAVGEWSSNAMPEDQFGAVNIAGLQEPPYSLEQLVYLAETHPVHSAAIEQKTVDVCGTGWDWEPIDEDQDADPELRAQIIEWFESLAPDDEDMAEVISAVWDDVETTGWGLAEIVRDPQGIARRIYHVPGHTVRAHRDGYRLVQMRGTGRVWFRRWGAADINGKRIEVDAKTGSKTKISTPANDLFVVKKRSRRSSWYGIPGYISGIGYLTLALAARDDNLLYFQNRREPRWAIVLTNLDNDPQIEEDIRRAFTVDLKQPHRNIILPITGDGKVEFTQLSGKQPVDGTFDKLAERADKAILIAHRIPGERLANTQIGNLGGNLAADVNRIYKEGVVSPSQELYDSRLNKLIKEEYTLAFGEEPTLQIKLDDLDIDTERSDADLALLLFHGDMLTLGEARHKLGLEPLKQALQTDPVTGEAVEGGEEIDSPYNEMLFSELPGVGAGATGPVGTAPSGTGGYNNSQGGADKAREAVDMALLRADVAELLAEGRETHERLSAIAASAAE